MDQSSRREPELSVPLLIVSAALLAALGAALGQVLWPRWGPLATALITGMTATCLLPLLSLRLIPDPTLRHRRQDLTPPPDPPWQAAAAAEVGFNLHQLLGETCQALAPAAEAQGISLLLSVAPGVPARVSGDPERLREMIGNLVRHALRHGAPGAVELCAEVRRGADRIELVVAVAAEGAGGSPRESYTAALRPA